MGSCRKIMVSAMFLLSCFTVLGQQDVDRVEYYNNLLREIRLSEVKEKKDSIASIIVNQARLEDNLEYLLYGLHIKARYAGFEKSIKYCDSIIEITKDDPFKVYPIEAYKLKGDIYFNNRRYQKALDNYLVVNDLSTKLGFEKYRLTSKYDIADLKRIIGEKKESLILYKTVFQESRKLETGFDSIFYLNSIVGIANVYNDLKKPDSASYYNKLGIKESVSYKNKGIIAHLNLNEGVSLFLKSDYKMSILKIEKHISYFESGVNNNNLPHAYYYLGKSYQKTSNSKKANIYFKKVDSLFVKENRADIIMKSSYQELIKYHKKSGDLKNELYYVNQFLRLDSLLHQEEIYLSKGIYKDYDIPQLKLEKELILKKMTQNESLFNKMIKISCVAFLLISLSLFYQYRKRINDNKKFNEIMNSLQEKASKELDSFNNSKSIEIMPQRDVENSHIKERKLNIPKETINSILEGLNKFEKNERFLLEETTLNSLANELNTNSNYLSKVVNYYKKKSFANYLNLLRIEYFILLSKENPTIRKFTIKAIANDVGFRNSESFSKAFLKHKGIKPSYFLKEMIKIEENN